MTGAELANGSIRGVHVAATMSVFGSMFFQSVMRPSVLGVSSDQTMWQVDRRIVWLVWISLCVAILAACLWLPLEAMAVSDDGSLDATLATIPIVLWGAHFGTLLLWRLALLLIACVIFRSGRSMRDRVIGTLFAAASVVLQVGLGHGLSTGGTTGMLLTLAEGLHLLAAAIWLGGLLPLLLMVDALPCQIAFLAVRRFSTTAAVCVLVLAVTIALQSWILVGSIAGLVGTDYGRLTAVKGLGFVLLLGLAALNRWRLTPGLTAMQGDRAQHRLRQSIAVETMIGLLVILAAGLLLTQAPAIHQQPDWPFAYQVSTVTLDDPDLRSEAFLGVAQLVAGGVIALLGCLCLLVTRRRWPWFAVIAAAMPLWWSTAHLHLFLVPAYPTSFYQSPTGFTAAAIVQGTQLFAANCTSCHGAAGQGDGPLAKTLAIAPADLTAPHLFGHSDGELFWWLSHGIQGPDGAFVMPGFADQLEEDDRWNLIDYIRAHNAGLAMRATGQWPQPMRAPDATVTIDTIAKPLSTQQGQLVRLVAADQPLSTVPPLPSGSTLPIVTIALAPESDGWAAYAVMAGVPATELAGTEFLIDRHGWLRRIFRPAKAGAAPDLRDFAAAAQDAEAHPIAAGMGGMAGMHHHE